LTSFRDLKRTKATELARNRKKEVVAERRDASVDLKSSSSGNDFSQAMKNIANHDRIMDAIHQVATETLHTSKIRNAKIDLINGFTIVRPVTTGATTRRNSAIGFARRGRRESLDIDNDSNYVYDGRTLLRKNSAFNMTGIYDQYYKQTTDITSSASPATLDLTAALNSGGRKASTAHCLRMSSPVIGCKGSDVDHRRPMLASEGTVTIYPGIMDARMRRSSSAGINPVATLFAPMKADHSIHRPAIMGIEASDIEAQFHKMGLGAVGSESCTTAPPVHGDYQCIGEPGSANPQSPGSSAAFPRLIPSSSTRSEHMHAVRRNATSGEYSPALLKKTKLSYSDLIK
jgi:hypothetical protein